VNFPILFLSLFWPGLTTRGAIVGASLGLASSVVLILVGPQVWVSVLGFERPLFPYNYPALFTLPLALLGCWWFSLTDRSDRGARDRDNYHRLLLRAEFGTAEASGAAGAVPGGGH
jgi:cation/acetate symporter